MSLPRTHLVVGNVAKAAGPGEAAGGAGFAVGAGIPGFGSDVAATVAVAVAVGTAVAVAVAVGVAVGTAVAVAVAVGVAVGTAVAVAVAVGVGVGTPAHVAPADLVEITSVRRWFPPGTPQPTANAGPPPTTNGSR